MERLKQHLNILVENNERALAYLELNEAIAINEMRIEAGIKAIRGW
jgi:hypothetical protein